MWRLAVFLRFILVSLGWEHRLVVLMPGDGRSGEETLSEREEDQTAVKMRIRGAELPPAGPQLCSVWACWWSPDAPGPPANITPGARLHVVQRNPFDLLCLWSYTQGIQDHVIPLLLLTRNSEISGLFSHLEIYWNPNFRYFSIWSNVNEGEDGGGRVWDSRAEQVY